jgi:DNA-binding CsgD family transcriptional regulator
MTRSQGPQRLEGSASIGLIGQIYDCAIDPQLWDTVLVAIRDQLDAAYVQLGFGDVAALRRGEIPAAMFRHSPWDRERLEKMVQLMAQVPEGGSVFYGNIDVAWTQLSRLPEEAFQQSPFYQNWVKPQNLRDCVAATFMKRDGLNGLFSAPSFEGRAPYDKTDCAFVETLLPHLRRALMINDISDKGTMSLTLFRRVLDSLSAALFILDHSGRIVFCNSKADRLLSNGELVQKRSGMLEARRPASDVALNDAIARAAKGDAALGIRGIGVPLIASDGSRAAAYVISLEGSDTRKLMGQGHCAVFVSSRGEQLPITVEILRTLFDMSQAEARVAALVATGDSASVIAEALGVTVNTVRSHIKGALTKTGTHSQSALTSCIRDLVPPVTAQA